MAGARRGSVVTLSGRYIEHTVAARAAPKGDNAVNTSKSSAGVALKRSSVIAVVLLSLLTGGFYTAIWYLRRRKGLNSLDSASKLGVTGPVILLIVTTAYVVLPPDSTAKTVALLAIGVTNLAMTFTVRWMIVDHLRTLITAVLPQSAGLQAQYSPSSILTFFLNIFYLQYKINELVEASDTWASADTAGESEAT